MLKVGHTLQRVRSNSSTKTPNRRKTFRKLLHQYFSLYVSKKDFYRENNFTKYCLFLIKKKIIIKDSSGFV